jgi:hypothetical protein
VWVLVDDLRLPGEFLDCVEDAQEAATEPVGGTARKEATELAG